MATPDAHQFYPEILPSATWTEPEGTVLSEIRQRHTQAHQHREQTGGCQRRGVGGGTGKDMQKAQTSGEKINSSLGCHGQHGDYS